MLRAKLPFFLAYARANNQPIFVEYIEIAAFGQYIDTGTVLSYNHKVTAVVKPVDDNSGANHIIFGNLVDQTKGFSCACANKVINSRFDGTLIADNFYRGGDTPHTYTVDKNGIVIDDEPIKTWNATPSDFTTVGTCFLSGNRGISNQPVNYMGAGSRIYDFKVWENDILVQHLRPCLHPQTFEACMYDTVTKQYFYNKGTGSFIPAPRFVEYIESDSTAYIDTGIAGGKDTLTVECKFMYNSFVSYGGIYGNYVSDSHNGIRCILANSGNRIITNNNTICTTSGNTELDCNISQIHTVISKHDTVILDGVATSIQNTEIGTENANNVALFNRSVINPNTSRDISLRVYDFKISENDTLLRHLRPCLRGNTPCMFDMVEGKYYMNVGIGTFKYSEINFVDYIRSIGTQWIDTGVEATSITRFIVKGTCDVNDNINAQLLGTTNNSASTFFGSRYMSGTGVKSWYCMDAEGVSIGNPTNLSIVDCTIESSTSQYGTLTDLVDNTISEFTSFSTSEWAFTTGNLLLFGGDTTRRSPNATCYSLQLYTANGLVRDLRPCLDYNNVACMFDIVTGKYFYNQGEGEFIAG